MLMRLIFILLMMVTGLRLMAQERVDQLYDSARHFQLQGKLVKARKMLDDYLSTSPTAENTGKLYTLLASILEDQGYQPLALEAFRKGKTLSTRTNQKKTMAMALNGIARLQTALGKYDSVMINLTLSRQLDTTRQNVIIIDQAEGRYWQTQNQYDQALTLFQQALNGAAAIHDEKNMAAILTAIGNIHFSHNPDMNVALDFFRRSNQLGDSLKPSPLMIRTYSRMGNAYMVIGDLKKAEVYLLKARAGLNDLEHLSIKAYALSSWAILLAEQGRLREAADFSAEPMQIKRELGDLRGLQNDLLNIAETRMMLGQYDEARKLLHEGADIGQKLHDIIFLKYFYQNLSRLDSATGNYKSAYSNFRKSIMYKDSTFSIEHLRAVNEIREKYEAEQKEKIIAEKELEIREQKYKLAIILGVSVTATLILVVILILVRSRSKTRLQQEKELRLQTIVKAQEDVQQRIARDLHDGLVQVLGAAQISLESVSENSKPELLRQQIQKTSGILEEAVMEARSISHEVLPYSLLKGGLQEALDELLSRHFDNYEFHKSSTEIKTSESESIHIFRIVQELVNNVTKHAEATHVELKLQADVQSLTLIFEDDGKGFDLNKPVTGMGLSNIKTRAELLKGTIAIRSASPHGTIVTLTIPR